MAFVIRGTTRLYFTGTGGQTNRGKEKITAEFKALFLEKGHRQLRFPRSNWNFFDAIELL